MQACLCRLNQASLSLPSKKGGESSNTCFISYVRQSRPNRRMSKLHMPYINGTHNSDLSIREKCTDTSFNQCFPLLLRRSHSLYNLHRKSIVSTVGHSETNAHKVILDQCEVWPEREREKKMHWAVEQWNCITPVVHSDCK